MSLLFEHLVNDPCWEHTLAHSGLFQSASNICSGEHQGKYSELVLIHVVVIIPVQCSEEVDVLKKVAEGELDAEATVDMNLTPS